MSDSTHSGSDSPPTVLIVDDDRQLADLYAIWFADDYEVKTAYSGNDALEQDFTTIDVVILDRRMPDISGDEVLKIIRDREGQCQIVMASAIQPDFDILEMDFDRYITKPLKQDQLDTVVDQMLERRECNEEVQSYLQSISKQAVLESTMSRESLAENEGFSALQKRITEKETALDLTRGEFQNDELEAVLEKSIIS